MAARIAGAFRDGHLGHRQIPETDSVREASIHLGRNVTHSPSPPFGRTSPANAGEENNGHGSCFLPRFFGGGGEPQSGETEGACHTFLFPGTSPPMRCALRRGSLRPLRICRAEAGLPSRSSRSERRLVPQDRIELSTYPLPRGCATTTLLRQSNTGGTARINQGGDARKGAMAGEKTGARNARLAAALKENLKRRKAKLAAQKGTRAAAEPAQSVPHGLGTAPQAGLQAAPQEGPKSALKQH
jgi:hypothetical protein